MKSKALNRPAKAELIKKRNSKIARIESSILKNKTRLKDEKKKLKADVSDLINSYPPVKSSKKKK